LKYFEFWARIQNKVIIFGDADITEKAYEIRKKFNRAEMTELVVVENPIDCAPDVYAAMERVEKQEDYNSWRERPTDISNEALYNYVMFLKFWMMRYVADTYPDSGTLVWLDFGFNHGGDCYVNPEEFDFLWKHTFAPDKVHLFALKDINEERGYLKLMCMTDAIMGATFICNSKKTGNLYDNIRECVLALASLDIIDDDQMWLTMAAKRWPEMFEIHLSNWFMPIKENGGQHLSIRDTNTEKSVVDFLKRRGFWGTIRYIYIKTIHRMSVERYDYWKRLKMLLRKYQ
jgi:protein YibB